MKSKILHVTQALGGVKTHISYIIDNSDEFEYVIVAPYNEELKKLCDNRNIKYYSIKFVREFSIFHDLSALFKIARIIRREKPALVHCHSAKGGFVGRLAAKFSKAKTIYTPHGLAYLSFTGAKRILFYLLEYMAKSWTDLFLAVSYSEANRGMFEIGYKYEKVNVVLNSVKVAETGRIDYERANHVGMIARLTYQKNPLLYLRIINQLSKKYPHLKFSVLGAGLHDHLADEVNTFIEQNALNNTINILPWGNESTSTEYLNTVDVFIMTSVFEGLPYSLLEAMSMGIPSIVSKADGNSDVIQNNENGFSCLDIDEFCNKIEALVSDKSLREKIGIAGRDYVMQQHNIKHNIQKLESIYGSMLAK